MADFRFERDLLKKGLKLIAGVDEVGRGALFGPVIAAAVIFSDPLILGPRRAWLREVNDSKLVRPAKRKNLARRICHEAAAVGIGYASSREVDEKNIYWASLEAMKKAVANLPLTPEALLIDGFVLNDVDFYQIGVRQGDRKCISIAAASILAKVFRDEIMDILNHLYGGYGLGKNKGYGTEEHYQALQELGPTALHRRTFNLRLRVEHDS